MQFTARNVMINHKQKDKQLKQQTVTLSVFNISFNVKRICETFNTLCETF